VAAHPVLSTSKRRRRRHPTINGYRVLVTRAFPCCRLVVQLNTPIAKGLKMREEAIFLCALPAATAGVRAKSDGNPNPAELLPQEHATAGPAGVTVGFPRNKVLSVPSNAFLNTFAAGSAPVFARGQRLFRELASLRFGRMSRFAAVGALGTLVNLLVVALLVHGVVDINYVPAAVVAAEVSILHNFVLQERFVFRDMRDGAGSWRHRLTQHQLFNGAEALVRLPFLFLLVELMHVWALLAPAVTLAIAFVGRFLFTSRVVYRGKLAGRHRTPATPQGMAPQDLLMLPLRLCRHMCRCQARLFGRVRTPMSARPTATAYVPWEGHPWSGHQQTRRPLAARETLHENANAHHRCQPHKLRVAYAAL
jgi:putative flippase GtrA